MFNSGAGMSVEEPLKTKAVRDLQAAQKERIYKQTLIRIKFPDRVCLQGYFHPRCTILDIYDWIFECLHDDLRQIVINSQDQSLSKDVPPGTLNYRLLFELYTSPPKCIYPPYMQSTTNVVDTQHQVFTGVSEQVMTILTTQMTQRNKPRFGDVLRPLLTLLEAKFVPAVLLHLSWAPGFPSVTSQRMLSSSSSASASATASATTVSMDITTDDSNNKGSDNDNKLLVNTYFYFRGDLLESVLKQQVENEVIMSDESVTTFPVGINLNQTIAEGKETTTTSSSDGGSQSKQTKQSKPKWLKM